MPHRRDGDITGQFINDGIAATLSKTAGTGVTRISGAVNLGGHVVAVRGETCTFTVTAQDVAADMAAGFTYLFDWDEGNPPEAISPTPGNGAGVSVDHAFVASGTYTVRVSAVDKAAA